MGVGNPTISGETETRATCQPRQPRLSLRFVCIRGPVGMDSSLGGRMGPCRWAEIEAEAHCGGFLWSCPVL